MEWHIALVVGLLTGIFGILYQINNSLIKLLDSKNTQNLHLHNRLTAIHDETKILTTLTRIGYKENDQMLNKIYWETKNKGKSPK